MLPSEVTYFNKDEEKRIYELITINDSSLKPFFDDDISLLQNNPGKYWNSFILNCKEENPKRHNLITKMQLFYAQLTIFE